MRPIHSRLSALAFPSAFAAAALGVLASTGCGDKSNDTAATTGGAYGEPVTSAPAVPAPAAPSSAPVTAASPTAKMPTPSGGGNNMPPADARPLANAPFAGGGGPMMGGGGDPNAPLSATPDMDKKIARLQTGDKVALAAAYADRGYARMTDENAGARVKYRKALEDYRAALQNDPANAKAKENKEMIENIYRDMKRPIPGEEAGAAKTTK